MNIYNNELLGMLSLQEVISITGGSKLSNAMLILPIIFHKKSLNYLAHKRTKTISFQDLLLTKPDILVSLNKRYFNFLPTTINCISLSIENGILELKDGELLFLSRLIDENAFSQLGNRAIKIQSASKNLATMLMDSSSNIYDLCGIKL
ncbi:MULTISPECIES: three component ABC system middle component [unclassified Serratia (in: enterobacteria)]|uniref:three component ABC system middle component n=1 Tax=unclassified Serratia (in: enterobacteria) TaxID=2647522 RepID=UPI0018A8C035|nr:MULTISPECIES: three component ABC system middle component [unclassified Serratia (in: enterobacteria)]